MDDVMEEVRRNRENLLEEFHGDLAALAAYLRSREDLDSVPAAARRPRTISNVAPRSERKIKASETNHPPAPLIDVR